MRSINFDQGWSFGLGVLSDINGFSGSDPERVVNLPHDYMIESDVREDAPAGHSSGYYTAGVAHYSKKFDVPAEWEGQLISLKFDGVMMNATVDVNGCKVALQHYGYTPFVVDITPYLYWGKENRVSITVNPSMQPNSRWYSGAGIFRSMELVRTPMVYIANDGIYGYTKRIDYDENNNATSAYLNTEITVCNNTNQNRLVMVEAFLTRDGSDEVVISRKHKIQINPNAKETAFIPITLDQPSLWNVEDPNLYQLHAKVTTLGVYRAHFEEENEHICDETSTLFGIRTITVDAKNGLRINGKTVKLKGGCLHHDNGVLGAVSLYDSEARKIKVLKEIGFNAIRTAHNPPSAVFMEACDRLGMYVFDEAFDAWGVMKQPGDYSMFFDADWEKDLAAFIKRDRNHPSVIIWSTGNEIPERSGVNNGYTMATKVANALKTLDSSRPISNGICSFWSGLDDELSKKQAENFLAMINGGTNSIQNVDFGAADNSWEEISEAFTNGLDVVGYNYMEDKYTKDHEMFPERVILGSENFPKEIGKRWPMVESTPYVLGDFTWTAWDYLGEAGIGKSVFFEPDDPILSYGSYMLMSHACTFPWRLANDADVDINGNILPQGLYRSIVWGSQKTFVFSYDPETFNKVEMTSMWGFTGGQKHWNWRDAEGKNVKILALSRAEEVEILINGKSIGKKKQGESLATDDLVFSFVFDAVYEPGEVVAIGYTEGKEVSRDIITTSGAPAALRLCPEVSVISADGHSLAYVKVEVVDENGNLVPTAEIDLKASVEGAGELLGFGSSNCITAENYTTGEFRTYKGTAMAVIRSGYEAGTVTLTVSGCKEAGLDLKVGE